MRSGLEANTIFAGPDYAAGISHALMDIFSTMFGRETNLVPEKEIQEAIGLCSILGFAGQISGFLCLHLSRGTACGIASGLLGFELVEVDETVRDAMGEMVNMLAGGLKSYLSSQEEVFTLSIPSIIEGKDYTTYAPGEAECMIFGVSAGEYRFKVQLVVEQS
jgi:chemotaxis protein CheX